MRIPLSIRIKALFASDKNAFWWNHFTDEEKELRSMDAWQLAKVIHEADIRKNNAEKRIVAEHLLNVRLANIQASASKWAGWLSAFGAVLASVASFYLGQLSASKPAEVTCTCNYRNEQQPVEKPVQPPKPSVIQPNPATGAVNENDSKSQGKQPNASIKP